MKNKTPNGARPDDPPVCLSACERDIQTILRVICGLDITTPSKSGDSLGREGEFLDRETPPCREAGAMLGRMVCDK